MATKLKEIPPGYGIKSTPGGNYLYKIKRTKRYKTPAKTRKKIAAAARRFKLPLLTTAAVGIPLGMAISKAGGFQALFTADGFKLAGSNLLAYYTGFHPLWGNWNLGRMVVGLGPLIAVMLINKSGLLKPVNQRLAKTRIPLRLS